MIYFCVGTSGVIELNNNINNINNNYAYAWSINSECDQIYIKSESFEAESPFDQLNIAGKKYSGSAIINTVIDGSTFSAVLSSENNVTSAEFVINWSCQTYNQTGSEGILWLGLYDDNEEIEWNIDSDCYAIHLVSTHFSTTENDDILTIDTKQYSGFEEYTVNQVIHDSSFVAYFTSDFSNRYTGFTIFWSCIPVINQTGSQGSLELGQYDNMQSLNWKIDSNCSVVQLESLYFKTQKGYDFLQIGDKEYSGSLEIDQMIGDSSFEATFRADGYATATGFSVLWSCYVGSIQRQYGINAIKFC